MKRLICGMFICMMPIISHADEMSDITDTVVSWKNQIDSIVTKSKSLIPTLSSDTESKTHVKDNIIQGVLMNAPNDYFAKYTRAQKIQYLKQWSTCVMTNSEKALIELKASNKRTTDFYADLMVYYQFGVNFGMELSEEEGDITSSRVNIFNRIDKKCTSITV